MPALDLPVRIRVKVFKALSERKRQRDSSRSGFLGGLLVGAVMVLVYLHIAAEPKLAVSSETVEFAPVSVDAETATKAVIVKNVGGVVLHVGDVEVIGSAAGEYEVSSGCTKADVPPQQSCTIDVSLKPTQAGERRADLVIPNDSDDKTAIVHLTGGGVVSLGPRITPEPVSLSFEQPANSSFARTLVLHSTGDEPAKIVSIDLTGAAAATFTVSQDCANAELPVSGNCKIEVTFAPTLAGTNEGTLEIAYQRANGNELVRVPLNAVASPVVPPDTPPLPPTPQGKLEVSPLEAPFRLHVGDRATPVQIMVSNVGAGPLTINRVEITSGADHFLSKNNCPAGDLAPNSNCVVAIYPETRDVGEFVGTLLVSSRDGDKQVPLSAQVVRNAVAAAKVSPSTIRIAGMGKLSLLAAMFNRSGNSVVHVYSAGDAPLVIDRLEFSSSYFAAVKGNSEETCRNGSQVAPGQECQVQVNFRQGAPSTTAELRIFDNATNSPQTVQLYGVAEPAKTSGTLQVSGGGDFGNVTVGRAAALARVAAVPAQRVITLRNSGNGNLALTNISLRGDSMFKLYPQCGNGLQPNATCSLAVTFQPISYGESTATIVIENNGSTGTQTVALRGTGVNPNIPQRGKIEYQRPVVVK